MQVRSVRVHNFRSLHDVKFDLKDYSLLVGANNSGKSNAIDALRTFYDKPKFDSKTDTTIGAATDAESWIEIDFDLTDEEYDTLKADYKVGENRLKVRKHLSGKKKGIFAYTVNGILADEQFYGARNVQQGKLGSVIHIPAVSTVDEHMKTSGPSTLREIMNEIVGKLAASSPIFQKMTHDFEGNIKAFREEETEENLSLRGLQDQVNNRISEWDTEFQINIDPYSGADIVKNLVRFGFRDSQIEDSLPAKSYGQGFQRHLIYTLLTLASEYNIPSQPSGKKEFKPSLTLILFEEPEAFLHPPLQDALCWSLQRLSEHEGTQVLASTHSPHFVSNNTENLSSIVRLQRLAGKTRAWQLSSKTINDVFQSNQEINDLPSIQASEESKQLKMEAIKYFLWLNPLRCGLFFADLVLLVEGTTEVVFVNYLMSNGKITMPKGGLFVLDCIGKHNIHRFMNLLGELGIKHSVMYDEDDMSITLHQTLSELIISSANAHTCQIKALSPDLEGFLGVGKAKKPYQKPQHLMYQYHQGAIANSDLNNFIALIIGLTQ